MFEWLLLHTLVVLALAVLVLLLGRCLRPGPAARHALWLVVLLKLLTPPLVYWPWSLPDPVPSREAAGVAGVRERPDLLPESAAGDEEVLVFRREALPPAPCPPAPPAAGGAEVVRAAALADARPAWRWGDLLELAGMVWLGGGLLVAARQAGRIVRVRRFLARAGPAPAWLDAVVREAAGAMGMRPPRVRVLAGIGSPLVWGLGRPRLLWPEGLEEDLSPAGRRAVLVHELAHLRRRDHWVGWLVLLGGCVWWWHPLFWLVRRRLGREAELACDAWVVGTLPGARRAYAEALVDVCERGSWAAAAVPALGAAGSRRDFERRLVMVMREEVPYRLSRQVLLAVGVLALLALPAWTLGQGAKASGDSPKNTTEGERTHGVTLAEQAQNKQGQPAVNASERDRKLKELEAKVQSLLKELQTLRAAAPKQPKPPFAYELTKELKAGQPVVKWKVNAVPLTVDVGVPAPSEITLTRKTYQLPAGKAEALARFLQEQVKVSVLETKVQGNGLVVTTTPDAQRVIGQFIGLLQGKQAAGKVQWKELHVPMTTIYRKTEKK